jgi:hypothetical protein
MAPIWWISARSGKGQIGHMPLIFYIFSGNVAALYFYRYLFLRVLK